MKYKPGDKVYVHGYGKLEFKIYSSIRSEKVYLMMCDGGSFISMYYEDAIIGKVANDFLPVRYVNKLNFKRLTLL